MILSHMASSCLNMNQYGTIWIHCKKSIIFPGMKFFRTAIYSSRQLDTVFYRRMQYHYARDFSNNLSRLKDICFNKVAWQDFVFHQCPFHIANNLAIQNFQRR